MPGQELGRFATVIHVTATAAVAGLVVSCRGTSPPEPAFPQPVESTEVAAVGGEINVVGDPVRLRDLGPIVVLLEPRSPREAKEESVGGIADEPVRIESSGDAFDPRFHAVRAGQTVVFVNQGPLKHRLFSADLGAEVSVGLDPGSEAGPLSLTDPGRIGFFCSLHPDESFVVYSSPADYFAVANEEGRYRFASVRPGLYTLSIWSEVVAGPVRDISVEGPGLTVERIWIDPDLIGP
jgi:plastocyanin